MRYWLDDVGAILLFFVNPPIGVQNFSYIPLHTSDNFRRPPYFWPTPPSDNKCQVPKLQLLCREVISAMQYALSENSDDSREVTSAMQYALSENSDDTTRLALGI